MMDKYKAVVSLVNGGAINDLLELCNNQFVNTSIQLYAGANRECLFCCKQESRKGDIEHLDSCPVVKYKELVKKHERWIVKK